MIQLQHKIIHLGMISGVSILSALFFYLKQQQGKDGIHPNETLQYIAMGLGFVFLVLGQILTRKMGAEFKPKDPQSAREYRNRYIVLKLIQWATAEGGALLNLVIFFLTGFVHNFYLGVGIVIVIALTAPSDRDFYSMFGISENQFTAKPKKADFE